MLELKWTHTGPARERSAPVPPKAPWIADYVVAFDEGRQEVVYLYSPEFHQFGAAWAFDGVAWRDLGFEAIRTESPGLRWTGHWDTSREAVVGWNLCRDDKYELVACGVMLTADGPKVIETTGDGPQRHEGFGEDGVIFAYDRGREVTVVLTKLGLWELDARGAWTKKRDAEGVPQGDWAEACHCAAYDGNGERVLFLLAAEDENEDDRLFAFTWDGETLGLLDNEGLPDGLITGWMNCGPIACTHPEHGVVLHCGNPRGFLRLEGDAWVPMDAAPMAPAGQKFRLAYDEKRELYVLGPGDLEAEPGEYPKEQAVFHVCEDGGWKKLGVTKAESPLKELWSTRLHHMAPGGNWFAMGDFYLHLLERDDEGVWQERVGKKAQQDLWDGGHSPKKGTAALAGMATDADGVLRAFSNEGHVLVLEDGAWVLESGPDELMKRRMWPRVAFDRGAGRIVLWGGEVRGRRNNHVFLLEPGKGWKQSKKKQPKPKAFARKKNEGSVDYTLYFDHGLGKLVRLGYEEIGVLEGEQFTLAEPARLGELNHERWRAVASDPETKQTLVLNWEDGTVFRLHPDGCEPVAKIALPDDFQLPTHIDGHFGYRALCDDWVYDESARKLRSQNPTDQWGQYEVDLSEAFAAAAKL